MESRAVVSRGQGGRLIGRKLRSNRGILVVMEIHTLTVQCTLNGLGVGVTTLEQWEICVSL